MRNVRVIARIDVKNEFVIKGIHLEGLRKIGDPFEIASKYYNEGIDELVFIDAVAAYYDRNSLSHIIEKATREVFVPITVGGGIRNLDDIRKALKSGADKVAINTAAVKDRNFVSQASKVFGSQCIVVSIVAKKKADGSWEAYTDNGREPTGLNVVDWASKVEEDGAGEILLTSLDFEGTKKGFELELYQKVQEVVSIPIIACGGMGKSEDAINLIKNTSLKAFACASILHYDIESIFEIKNKLINNEIDVRL